MTVVYFRVSMEDQVGQDSEQPIEAKRHESPIQIEEVPSQAVIYKYN